MAEHINDDADLLASGGHVWRWSEPPYTRKRIGSVGLRGEWSMTLAAGSRPGRIEGRTGGPAILKASGADQAAAEAAMGVLEDAIRDLVAAGDAVAWEDDQGNIGASLLLDAYRPTQRVYSRDDTDVVIWQYYRLDIFDLDGGA